MHDVSFKNPCLSLGHKAAPGGAWTGFGILPGGAGWYFQRHHCGNRHGVVEAGHTTNWESGGSSLGGTGDGLPQVLTVYGTIASGQSPTVGAYTDLLTVTVNY